MRIGHARGSGVHAAMARTHRAHISRSETGDAATGRDAHRRRASSTREPGRSLSLCGKQFSGRVSSYPNGHARHVISNEEGVLLLDGLRGAIAGGFQVAISLGTEPSTIGGAGSGKLFEFLLNGVAGSCAGAS